MDQLRKRQILRQSIQLAALALLSFAAYFPVLQNGFIWDDNRYIEDNSHLHTLHGLKLIWLQPLKAEPQYYPLTHTTFWIEYHLWHLNPRGYHLDNLVLHILSAAILWRLLLRLNVPGAWLAATIFAVHPVQAESVAWATERKNVLSGLLYFLSLSAYLRTRPGRRIWTDEYNGRAGCGWYSLSLMLFIAALLSKSVASTMPAVILLLLWWKRGKIRAADIYPILPMFAAGLAMGSLTGWMEKHVVGAVGPNFDFLTPLDRSCIAGRAVWFYLAKLAWPADLAFIYPHWQVDPTQRLWWILFPLSACGLLAALWLLRTRTGRGPLTAMLFFAGTLLPALGFVNVFPMQFSYVANHFQYLACIGPITLLVALFIRIGERVHLASLVRAAISALILCLCIASSARSRIYQNRLSLWTDTLSKNPDSPMVHNNYGYELMKAGKLADARSQFQLAMKLDPNAADWTGIGQTYAIAGDYSNARDMYQKAIDSAPRVDEPVFRQALAGSEFQLGTAYQALAGEFPDQSNEYFAQAEAAYKRAIDLFPDYEIPRTNLASILVRQNRYAEAIEQCNAVLRENPESFSACMNLGNAYYAQGQLDPAKSEYQRALDILPDNPNALASIGGILVQQGHTDKGIAMLRSALAIDPNNILARQNLFAAIAHKPR